MKRNSLRRHRQHLNRVERSQGFSLPEAILALGLFSLVITASLQLSGTKGRALSFAKNTGELRDLRNYLHNNVDCLAAVTSPACQGSVIQSVEGKKCDGSTLVAASSQGSSSTIIGNNRVRLLCGGSIPQGTIEAQYKSARGSGDWKSLNKNVPWTCSAPTAAVPPPAYSWQKMALSDLHGCALTTSGDVYCWGANHLAAIQSSTLAFTLTMNPDDGSSLPVQGTGSALALCPIKATLSKPATDVWTQNGSTCIKDSDGIKCWGAKLPNIDEPSFFARTNVFGLSPHDFVKYLLFQANEISRDPFLTTLDSSFFVTSADQSGMCQAEGREIICSRFVIKDLDRSTLTTKPQEYERMSAKVTGISGTITGVSGGPGAGCAIVNGGVSCWTAGAGWWNAGFAPSTIEAPSNLSTGSGIIKVVGGGDNGCALNQSGEIWCWGSNLNGELGSGAYSPSPAPSKTASKVTNISNAKDLYAMFNTRCALDEGSIKCWGEHPYLKNPPGRYPPYTETPRRNNIATYIEGFENDFTSLTCSNSGYRSCCAIHKDGKTYCFGRNGGYMLTNKTDVLPSAELSKTELFSACSEFNGGGSSGGGGSSSPASSCSP